MRANLSDGNEFACISLHFMLDRVQPLEYKTGLLKDKLTFARLVDMSAVTSGGRQEYYANCGQQGHFYFRLTSL